jgi:hypothetical protein
VSATEVQIHRVTRKMNKDEAKQIIGDDVSEKEPTCTKPGIYVDSETDAPVFVYLPMPSGVAELRHAVLNLKMTTTPRTNGLSNISRTFGMAPRRPMLRREACVATSMSIEQPDSHDVICDLADVFTKMMVSLLPDIAENDHDTVEQVLPEWRMTEDSLWTSGVVNQSSTLPYHLDGANFKTWSAMPVIRRGMRGGYLDIPEYDLVCACRDGWVTFFLGKELVHGVTPMRPITKDAYRYSIVYYALRGMKDCFTVAVEQARARETRGERENNWVDDSIDITATDE